MNSGHVAPKIQKYVAIIDFGGQYTHMIAKKVRALGVLSLIFQPGDFNEIVKKASEENLMNDKMLSGVILSGGPRSVLNDDAPGINLNLNKAQVPILGICYGHQLIARHFGGLVVSEDAREYGFARIICDSESPVFKGIKGEQRVWMSHGDHVEKLPDGFNTIARSDEVSVAAYESSERRIYGFQFHPEVYHTENGLLMLENFISLCTVERNWNPGNLIGAIENKIKSDAGKRKTLILLSGGVDSLVAAILCGASLPHDQILSIHVDTGLMRENESEDVINFLNFAGLKNVELFDASNLFLSELAGITDPEEKRSRIGRLFVEVIHKKLMHLGLDGDWVLVQGTIYPDTIESGGTQNSAKIKTHHNRVPEIEELIRQGRVIEPLKDFYKDELREIGKNLGISEKLLMRHPFPGPGLGIRIICSNKEPDLLPDENDKLLLKEIAGSFGYDSIILPVRSVGVQGDERTYSHPAVIWRKNGNLSWDDILNCASRTVNSLKSVNRVVFSLNEYNEQQYHIGEMYVDRANLDLLRAVDAISRRLLDDIEDIWQMPVVCLPLFNQEGGRVFVLRPVTSRDAMTADVYRMDFGRLFTVISELKKLNGVSHIFYDVTTKPPGTIEWE